MKRLIFIVIIIFCGLNARAQVVYSTDWKSEAQVKVYVTEYKSEADLIVYKTNWKSEVDAGKGIWYFTQYKSEAGWRKKSKQHQMY